MKLNGAFVLAACGLAPAFTVQGATATPVNRTPATAPYAAPTMIAPARRVPEANETLRRPPVEKPMISAAPARPADQPAAVDPAERRALPRRDKDVWAPEVLPRPAALEHRAAAISTAGDTVMPPRVSRFQEGLRAASAANMARFPAVGKATTAKINRFVFRKNAPEAPLPQPGRAANGS